MLRTGRVTDLGLRSDITQNQDSDVIQETSRVTDLGLRSDVLSRQDSKTISDTMTMVEPSMFVDRVSKLSTKQDNDLFPTPVVLPSDNNQKKKLLLPLKRRVSSQKFGAFLKNRGGRGYSLVGVGSRSEALNFGADAALRSLSATFKVVPIGGMVEDHRVSIGSGLGHFREYRISRGVNIVTPGTFIQKRGERLVTVQERSLLQGARKGRGWL